MGKKTHFGSANVFLVSIFSILSIMLLQISCLPFLMLMDLIIVDSFMFFQTTRLTKFLVTLWAAEWFIFSMNSFMSLPSTAIWEFTQFEQLKGFSSVWILSCVFKCCDWLNFFSHFEQLNSFSSVFQALLSENLFSHFEQLNGFSSVWILSCVFKRCDGLNLFSHFEQLNGFISMHSSMCLQIVWTTALLFTLWAAEWFFISMNSFMCLQMLWLTERHEHFMFFQTTWLTEILVTLWAAEWFIFSMNYFMSLPSTAIWEFTQLEQLEGFSLVWILSCVFKCCDWLNFFFTL